jgi:hypothetical protein
MIDLPIWAKAFLLASVAFFMPLVPAIILTGAFVAADTATGIWAAVKRGEVITSRKMSQVITKTFVYQGALLLAFGIDVVLLGGGGMFVAIDHVISKLVMMTVVFIETVSIDENITSITGKSMIAAAKQAIGRAAKLREDLGGLS